MNSILKYNFELYSEIQFELPITRTISDTKFLISFLPFFILLLDSNIKTRHKLARLQ